MVSRKTNCHDVVRCVCRPESADPTLTFGCVCAAVCSFYIREAHASAKSLPAGASDTSAIVPRPTRDMRWRASFAVQLYEALGNPGFGALQPWLFDTSLQKLQPLVQRFWHVGHLGLMEKLLRFVVEHNVRLVAIEGALKGWHKAKAKAGRPKKAKAADDDEDDAADADAAAAAAAAVSAGTSLRGREVRQRRDGTMSESGADRIGSDRLQRMGWLAGLRVAVG